jgi:2-oxoisovalerate ferredoxin oxidoreductase beta subunit
VSESEYQVAQGRSPVFYEHFDRKSELQNQTHYCPGCGHGIAHKLVAEAIEDMGLQDRAVFTSPVGCSVFAYYYFDVGNVQAAHGRASAVAVALKRAHPQSLVISYQGDGDLAAIGTAEIVHAANRGEKFTVFFINNAIYGMTGGQLAPTTLVGQTSTTSPWGRRPSNEGFPLHIAELLSSLQAPVYIERVALSDNKNIMKARKAIRKALEVQRDGLGFSLVEILSPCPTIWKMDPVDAQKWVAEKMIPSFPLGVYRDRIAEARAAAANPPAEPPVPHHSVREVVGEGVEEPRDSAVLPRTVSGPRTLRVKVAGFGGQGVLLLGEIIAKIGMRVGMNVSWLPSYGPEMRSGSANCHVCLSDERIGSPMVDHPDVLVAMNEISLRKFASHVLKGGTILYNREAVPAGFSAPQAHVLCLPASDLADKLGAAKAANMIMLGALAELTGMLPLDSITATLEKAIRNKALLEVDKKAIETGREFVEREALVAGR